MGIAGDPFFCPSWEPGDAEDEGRMERRLREARENLRLREAAQEREQGERDESED